MYIYIYECMGNECRPMCVVKLNKGVFFILKNKQKQNAEGYAYGDPIVLPGEVRVWFCLSVKNKKSIYMYECMRNKCMYICKTE